MNSTLFDPAHFLHKTSLHYTILNSREKVLDPFSCGIQMGKVNTGVNRFLSLLVDVQVPMHVLH
jgi:hypothetical protein